MDRRQTYVMLIWLTLDTVFVILGDSFVSVLGLAWPETESLKDISTIVSKISVPPTVVNVAFRSLLT